MLLSDMWQPAVLQLLPFSSNDACNPQSPTPGLRSLPTPDHSRGFPVLAVTRNPNPGDSASSESSGGGGASGHSNKGLTASFGSTGGSSRHKPASRVLSERLTRSQTRVENSSAPVVPVTPRAKSDYLTHRSGVTVSSGRSNGGATQSREHATCSFTDMSEKFIGGQGTSPDSGAGSVKNSPYTALSTTSDGRASHGAGGGGGGGGGNARTSAAKTPSSSFSPNALTPGIHCAAAVLGSGTGGSNGGGEGRFASKNGLWRSVNLTPGEQELKKHREQLDHSAGDSPKNGRRYHKLNVRDLPRSTTPLNDHDPDKLNMKQVIAFLQTKGKSQAAADSSGDGSKPGQVKVKVNNQDLSLPRTTKSGVMRGSVKKAVPASTAAEVCLRAAGRLAGSPAEMGGAGGVPGWARDGAVSASSPVTAARRPGDTDTAADGARSSASPAMPHIRSATDRLRTTDSRRSSSGRRDSGLLDRHDAASDSSPRKLQKKPFRLHRFLTMVPSPRDPGVLTALAYSTTSRSEPQTEHIRNPDRSHGHAERPASYYKDPEVGCSHSVHQSSASGRHAARTTVAVSKSAHKERTLCLDLASQSKSQSKPEHAKSHMGHHHHQPRGGGGHQGSVSAGSEGKVQYRLTASRPRPSSLRVEQDALEARLKLTADFGEREYTATRPEPLDCADLTDEVFNRQEKNVIRLPFVMVDSEDEDPVGDPLKRQVHAKAKHRDSAKSAKSARSTKSASKAPPLSWLRLEKTKTKTSRQAAGMHQPSCGPQGDWTSPNNHNNDVQASEECLNGQWPSSIGSDQNTSSVVGTVGASSDTVSHWTTAPSPEDVISVDQQQDHQLGQPEERPTPVVEERFLPTIGLDVNKPVVSDVKATDNNNNNNAKNIPSNKTKLESDKKQPNEKVISGGTSSSQSVPKKVKVNVPSLTADGNEHTGESRDDVTKPARTTQQQEYAVTLSLRKERHRTRERTYMSEIAGSDVLSDDTCGARVNSDSVRPSLRSDDVSSWTSSKC